MKKYLSLALVLLLVLSMLSGCKEAFDMDKSIRKLQQNGLVISQEYKTDFQLKQASALFNAEIKFYGGNFKIEVKYAITLESPKEPGSNCQFIELISEQQAEQYAEHYVKVRRNGNEYRVAQSGAVVIITNLDIATEIIPLEFK